MSLGMIINMLLI